MPGSTPGGRPTPVLHLYATSYCDAGDADPSVPGGMTMIYRDLMASEARTRQVITDVTAALAMAGTACPHQLDRAPAEAGGRTAGRGDDPVIRARHGRQRLPRRSPGCSRNPAARHARRCHRSLCRRGPRLSAVGHALSGRTGLDIRESSSSTRDTPCGRNHRRSPPKSTITLTNKPGCSPRLPPSAHLVRQPGLPRPSPSALHTQRQLSKHRMTEPGGRHSRR